jgi:hypothetical protein
VSKLSAVNVWSRFWKLPYTYKEIQEDHDVFIPSEGPFTAVVAGRGMAMLKKHGRTQMEACAKVLAALDAK